MGWTKFWIPNFIFLFLIFSFTMEDSSTGPSTCGKEVMQENYLSMAAYFIGKVQQDILSDGQTESEKEETDDLSPYLDMDIINKVKEVVSSKDGNEYCSKPIDCADLFYCGHRKSGVYSIRPKNYVIKGEVKVYCDMVTDGGGWTVIQRRGDYGNPDDYFFKDWASYKTGFGDVEKDFWLGNDLIFAISNQKAYSIRFDLRDFEGAKRHAHYDSFRIENERRKYTLRIEYYSGDAGDAMINHNNKSFTTKDRDSDEDNSKNCAESFKGGWWYRYCHHANLNGLFHPGGPKVPVDYKWMIWHPWKGWDESLAHTEMKIRGRDFSDL